MSVIVIAAISVLLVLFLILGLKLHPLLSLLLASVFLFVCTPLNVRRENSLAEKVERITKLDGGNVGFEREVAQGDYIVIGQDFAQQASLKLEPLADELSRASRSSENGYFWYQVSGSEVPVTVGLEIISSENWNSFDTSPVRDVGKKVADGFAKTFRKLGIPVTMAAIIGVCLLESGAAARIVGIILRCFGTRGTGPALTFTGFTLGIPVYFDNVFYLLLPLAKAAGRKRPEFYLSAVMAIIVGATMAHSLVPPTPGPLLVASAMNVSLGAMMIGGLVVGAAAACVGLLYGGLCNRWVKLSPSDSATQPKVESDGTAKEKNREQSNALERKISAWLAILPIGLPIVVLGGAEVLKSLAEFRGEGSRLNAVSELVSVVSEPNLIFLTTALLAIAILRRYTNAATVTASVAKGLSDAGTIVLLTCAGGAFGNALQQLQLADAISSEFQNLSTPWGVLVTAFLLTTIIRAAQGSATVAMITSAAIVAPVMQSIELPFHPLYVALAIGCGSKPLPWMNDSGFWQVATMTGMSTTQTLQTFTVALTLMGITGFAVTCLGAWLIPLI